MGMIHAGLPGTLLPALAELCSIRLHVGHVPILVWNICLCKTTDAQDAPSVPHHNKPGKPLKGACSRLRERCLGRGRAGVSLRARVHPWLPSCSWVSVVSVTRTLLFSFALWRRAITQCILKILLPDCFVFPADFRRTAGQPAGPPWL